MIHIYKVVSSEDDDTRESPKVYAYMIHINDLEEIVD